MTPSAATPTAVDAGATPTFEPFDQPIGRSGLPGAAALRRSGGRLGIVTVRDLLFAVPRRWIPVGGHRSVREIRQLERGTVITARLQLVSLQGAVVGSRRLQRTVARLQDEEGDQIEAVWFGRQFIERRIGPPGGWLLVAGKVGIDNRDRATLQNPDFELERAVAGAEHDAGGKDGAPADALLPVYRLTEGIRARTLRRATRAAIDTLGAVPGLSRARGARRPGLHRPGRRDHPLPGRPGGARPGARPTRLRRAARAPGGHGLATPAPGTGPRVHGAGERRPDGRGDRGHRAHHRCPDRGTHRSGGRRPRPSRSRPTSARRWPTSGPTSARAGR